MLPGEFRRSSGAKRAVEVANLSGGCGSLSISMKTEEKCFGITLISTQRYITVRLCGTMIEMIMMETPLFAFVMLHWFIPLLITAPLTKSFGGITYESRETMEVIVPQSSLASSQVEFRLVLNSATPFPERCYQAEKKMGGVWNQLWMFGFSNKRRKKRHEIRLSIQFAGLMIAFLFFFVYSVGQYVFNHTRQIALLYEWRQLNPLMNCFLSCIQPWMCLFFNNDIRGKLLRILGYRRSEVKQTSFVMPVTSHTSRK
ncbi:hypothetical protein RB195_003299 [Necator americanus]|uniref:7TM GPCR serpentine receptor class x (Srx) domain-containing protein n=1 Tax=Necator americanus TaxID=51031 RepID=A0ABR1DMX3_NECAM